MPCGPAFGEIVLSLTCRQYNFLSILQKKGLPAVRHPFITLHTALLSLFFSPSHTLIFLFLIPAIFQYKTTTCNMNF